MAKELLFAIDNFNTPKKLDDTLSNSQLLYYALMGRDDTRVTEGLMYQLKKYRFKDLTEAIGTISSTLSDYCSMHIPNLIINDISVQPRTETSIILVVDVIDKLTTDNRKIIFNVTDSNTKLLVDLIQ